MDDVVDQLDDLSNVDIDEIDDLLVNQTIGQFDASSESVFFTPEDLGNLGPIFLQEGELSQSDVADFLRESRPSPSEPCPTGFICSADEMANCTKLRIVAVLFGFGDVHAGSYCPLGVDGLLNCPVGFYCETPETLTPCPSGKFCPHKTLIPEIDCHQCDEGEIRVQRDLYGFIVLMLILLGLVFYAAATALRRYRKETYQKFKEIANRQLNPMRRSKHKLEEQNRLERIRPKLFSINERLRILHAAIEGADTDEALPNPIEFGPESKVRYDPNLLFDLLDVDQSGSLDYAELNKVLELSGPQLRVFIRRMNELDGTSANHTVVSNRCFVHNFLSVLEETSNFGPTETEAAALFDSIDKGKRGYIESASLFLSQLSTFLTDPQINQLIKHLGRLESSSAQQPPRRSFSVRKSTNKNIISRETFKTHYPTVLQKVVEEPIYVPSMRDSEDEELSSIRMDKQQSVDLTFDNLCLAVTVGDGKKVNVVNGVSGRCPAGTMTALMGGSGAGKTSLLNALCGRAFYGETTGKIYINGHEAKIDDHKGVTGFVPQDDIVFAELTVKECLMYAGRFSAPKGTSIR
eukprot:scaffold4510_cov183-Amphora_coffeaeformis.AAC.98